MKSVYDETEIEMIYWYQNQLLETSRISEYVNISMFVSNAILKKSKLLLLS